MSCLIVPLLRTSNVAKQSGRGVGAPGTLAVLLPMALCLRGLKALFMSPVAYSLRFRLAAVGLTALAAGCNGPTPIYAPVPVSARVIQPAPAPLRVQAAYVSQGVVEAPPPVVSVYIEPPLFQPPPLLVLIAPPPMLVEVPPAPPFPLEVWTGGYWAWHGGWVWSAGRWLAPPRPDYAWVQPYYEHRGDAVVYVDAHWAPPNVVFVPPPFGLQLVVSSVIGGFARGPAPIGPQGVFVPPPPGSQWGLVVPAPIGTAPAVVVSAPAIIHIGMRVENRVTNINSNNVTTRQVTNNITNITNVRNVTIIAPAGATANGRAFEAQVPAAAHLAAAQPAQLQLEAPRPANPHALAAFVAGQTPIALPAAQAVRVAVPAPALRSSAAAPPPAAEPPVHAAVPARSLAPVAASNAGSANSAAALEPSGTVEPPGRNRPDAVRDARAQPAGAAMAAQPVEQDRPARMSTNQRPPQERPGAPAAQVPLAALPMVNRPQQAHEVYQPSKPHGAPIDAQRPTEQMQREAPPEALRRPTPAPRQVAAARQSANPPSPPPMRELRPTDERARERAADAPQHAHAAPPHSAQGGSDAHPAETRHEPPARPPGAYRETQHDKGNREREPRPE